MGGMDYPVVHACLRLAGSRLRPHLTGSRAAVDDQFAPGDENARDVSSNRKRGDIVDFNGPACCVRLRCLRS